MEKIRALGENVIIEEEDEITLEKEVRNIAIFLLFFFCVVGFLTVSFRKK